MNIKQTFGKNFIYFLLLFNIDILSYTTKKGDESPNITWDLNFVSIIFFSMLYSIYMCLNHDSISLNWCNITGLCIYSYVTHNYFNTYLVINTFSIFGISKFKWTFRSAMIILFINLMNADRLKYNFGSFYDNALLICIFDKDGVKWVTSSLLYVNLVPWFVCTTQVWQLKIKQFVVFMTILCEFETHTKTELTKVAKLIFCLRCVRGADKRKKSGASQKESLENPRKYFQKWKILCKKKSWINQKSGKCESFNKLIFFLNWKINYPSGPVFTQ